MDLGFQAIHDVVHATSAFSGPRDEDGDHGDDGGGGGGGRSWGWSQLNPKNRIDSLAPVADPKWRIDGCAGFGTQFYAYPLFLERPPPMHIDVFIHEGVSYPPVLRGLLDLDRAFHTKDSLRVQRLGVAQHILRILERYTAHGDGQLHIDVMKSLYGNGPFGSRIVIENLSCHIHEAQIVVSPNYPLENDLMSYEELKDMWGLRDQQTLPPEVNIGYVHMVRQLHDSICEVRVNVDGDRNQRGSPSGQRGHRLGLGGQAHHESQLLILKSLSSGVKYMYQEIRALIKDIPPHSGILSKPLHIISKNCLFGRKRGVIGFTMPYHTAGSLRDALPLLRIHGQLLLADQLRWSCQLTEAMCHVWHQGHSFYPDLRLDNVVLTAPAPESSKQDAGLVDFEQRGVWCSFSAPEVDYIESLRILAFDDQDFDFAIPEEICREYKQKLVECYEAATGTETMATALPAAPTALPQGKPKRPMIVRLEEETKYSNPALGYNVTWTCLTKREQEAAMVYMLGRLLWCIFEGMSAPHRGAVWQSYPREPELEFPAFQRTPPKVQKLITKCFGDVGAREQSKYMRRASKLYFKQDLDGETSGPPYELVSDNLTDRAREFWHRRLEEGDRWLRERNERLRRERNRDGNGDHGNRDTDGADGKGVGGSDEMSAHGRPTLRQVLQWLQELDGQLAE